MEYILIRKIMVLLNHQFILRIFLIIALVSFGGCLEAFTRAANQPPTAHYEGGEQNLSGALPTPQLLDIRLNISDD